MLSDAQLRLLSASVDGELSADDQRKLRELTAASPEAVAFLAELERNAAALRNLPRIRPSDNLSEEVLDIIAVRGLTPTPLPPRRRQPAGAGRHRRFVGTAAACFVGLVLLSFLWFSRDRFATNTAPNASTLLVDNRPLRSTLLPSGNAKPPLPQPRPQAPLVVRTGPEAPTENEDDSTATPPMPQVDAPPGNPPTALTGPTDLATQEPFRVVRPAPSGLLTLSSLAKEPGKIKFADVLTGVGPFRVELFAHHLPNGIMGIQNALKGIGTQVTIEPLAQDRLSKNLPTQYAVLIDQITPSDLSQVLLRLTKEKMPVGDDKIFEDTTIISGFVQSDFRDLSLLLGIDAKTFRGVPGQTGGLKPDPTKPLVESTASHLLQTLPKAGTGAVRRPFPALVLSFSPMRANPNLSKELQIFLKDRSERKPGYISVLFIVRQI